MREDVGRGDVRSPAALVQPVAVLREACKVYDTEVAAAGRQRDAAYLLAPAGNHLLECFPLLLRVEIGEDGRIHIERSGLSKVVVARPDKLSGAFRDRVLVLPLKVRLRRPAGSVKVIGTHLEGGIHGPALALFLFHGKAVIPSCGYAGGRFRAIDRLAGMLLNELLIQMRLVVESVDVYGFRIGLEGGPGVVVAGGGGTGGVFAVADIGKHLGNPPAGTVSLLPAFIADAPGYDGRMVPVPADHGGEVFFRPIVKESGVAVFLFGPGPGVSELVQDKEAHAVAEVQELRCRRVVAGADGVAAHVLEHLEAADPGVVTPHCAKGSGVVVEADALEEGLLSVEVVAIGPEFRGADAERGLVCLCDVGTIGLNGGAGYVHLGTVRGPEAGTVKVEGLDDGASAVNLLHAAGFRHYVLHYLAGELFLI